MKITLSVLLIIISACLISSCSKEDEFASRIFGDWNVIEKTIRSTKDTIIRRSDIESVIKLFEDGTGKYNEYDSFWTLSPDNSQIYFSIDLISDTLRRSYRFDIVPTSELSQTWRQEELLNNSNTQTTVFTKWELSKIE